MARQNLIFWTSVIVYKCYENSGIYKFSNRETMSDELHPQLKQVPKTKKENSYTYWVDENNKSRDLPAEHLPKKVEAPVQPVISQQGPSAWNSCGTWQQKKISMSQIQTSSTENLKQLMTDKAFQGVELGEVKIEGDAYKVYKKSKWGAIYEIHGSIEFKLQEKKGKVKLVELTNLGDREYEVSGSAEIRKIIQPMANAIVKAVQSALTKHNT